MAKGLRAVQLTADEITGAMNKIHGFLADSNIRLELGLVAMSYILESYAKKGYKIHQLDPTFLAEVTEVETHCGHPECGHEHVASEEVH